VLAGQWINQSKFTGDRLTDQPSSYPKFSGFLVSGRPPGETAEILPLETVHFKRWGVLVVGMLAMPKKMASKGGGGSQKICCVNGGYQTVPFRVGSDSICNNANISARMPKNSISKVLKIPIFPGEHAPNPPPLLSLYTQRQLYPTNGFVTKYSQDNFWPLLVYSKIMNN